MLCDWLMQLLRSLHWTVDVDGQANFYEANGEQGQVVDDSLR
jgi:hypothetical protein